MQELNQSDFILNPSFPVNGFDTVLDFTRQQNTKTTTLSRILKGEEQTKQLKQNIVEYSDELKKELKMFADTFDKSEKEYQDFMEKYENFKIVIDELEKYTK